MGTAFMLKTYLQALFAALLVFGNAAYMSKVVDDKKMTRLQVFLYYGINVVLLLFGFCAIDLIIDKMM